METFLTSASGQIESIIIFVLVCLVGFLWGRCIVLWRDRKASGIYIINTDHFIKQIIEKLRTGKLNSNEFIYAWETYRKQARAAAGPPGPAAGGTAARIRRSRQLMIISVLTLVATICVCSWALFF